MPYRKKKLRKAPLPDVEDVLSGRVRADAGTLIDLIARVNPTGLALPKREAAARYARKSALQNLLIRQHADDLVAEAQPGQERIVSLRHRRLDRFACHVMTDDLDDEARSWVRMQLDLREAQAEEKAQEKAQEKKDGARREAAAGRAPAGRLEAAWTCGSDSDSAVGLPGNGEEDPAALVRHGLSALEEYDYERARSCLEKAFKKSGGDGAPAEALLALLVDNLGAYEEALSIVPGLSRQARRDDRVRVLLAAAAARARRRDEALSWADGLTGERAAAVDLILADQAIEGGDWKEARERLRSAGSRGSNPLELLAREKKIETLLALERRPHEEKLQELWEDGQVEQAACAARQILEKWPGSRPARTVLQQVESEERARDARRLLEKAERELGRSAFAETMEVAREASRLLGGDRERVAGIIAAAEAGLQRRAQEARMGAVLDLLSSEDPSGGYLAYLDLDEECRSRMRRQIPSRARVLAWLEEAGAPIINPRKRSTAIAAVRGLEAAIEALDAGRDVGRDRRARLFAEEALALLQKHAEALEGVADARRAMAEAREKVEEARIEQVRAAITRAEEALKSGDPRGALESLGPVDAGRLPAGLRDRVDSLLKRIRSEEASRMLADRFSSCMERGDLLAAREAAQALAAGADEPEECRARPPGAPKSKDADGKERQTWRTRVDEVSRLIRRQFCLRVLREPADSDRRERVDEVPYFFSSVGCTARLTADGRFLVQVDSLAGRLFIRLVDVGTSLVSAAVSLKTPQPMKGDAEVEVMVEDGSIWVADLGGLLLRLDLRTWDVEGWHRLAGLIAEGERFEEVVPIPGGRFVWISTSRDDRESWGGWTFHTRVVDLREMRVYRDLGEQELTTTLVAGPTPRLLWKRPSGDHCLMDPRGTEIEGVRLGAIGEVSEASAHPGGSGLVLLAGDEDEDEENDDTLKVVSLDGQGSVRTSERLEGSHEDFCHSLATSRSAAASFVLFSTGIGGPQRLAAFTADGEDLRKTYEIDVPQSCVLVGDAWANRAALLYRKGGAAAVVPLTVTREPPDIQADPETDDRLPMFSFELPPPCWHLELDDERASYADSILRGKSERELDRVIEHFFEEEGKNPGVLADLARSLAFTDKDRMRQVTERAFALHPDNPGLALLHAEAAAEEGRWGEVIETLDPVRPRRLDPPVRRHLAHLLGMARYATGEVDAALKLWKNAGDPEVSLCELAPYINLARPLRPDNRGAGRPLVRRLLAAVRAADEALELGDAGSALEAADCNAVWRAGEVQSLARLAESFLRVEPALPMQRYRKAMALALFISRHDETATLRNELLLSPGHVERGQLDALRARALAWLERFDVEL